MTDDHALLLRRIERLERRNRLLGLAVLGLSTLTLVGWQTSPTLIDALRVRSLEVVDGHGVPMIQLTTGRKSDGGSIVLRDRLGEKRGWWQVAPDGSNLTMAADAGDDNASTAGFGVTPTSSRMVLISPKGASLSTTIERDEPRLDLYSTAGKVLFSAPWRTAR